MGSTSTKVKKNETKTAFKQWNTDGDKFLTFKEFDAGMQSLGITQESFIVGSVAISGGPYLGLNMPKKGISEKRKLAKNDAFI